MHICIYITLGLHPAGYSSSSANLIVGTFLKLAAVVKICDITAKEVMW